MKQLLTILLLAVSSFLAGQNIPAKPEPARLVNDFSHLLTPEQAASLEATLVAFDDSTTIQVAIVIVPTLEDYAPVDYAVKLGREWGIGNKKTNNGVVLLISTEPGKRKIFIAPGYGMEGALPDITCRQIVANEITPEFKNENYYRGLERGIAAIIQAGKGEYKAPEGYNKNDGKGGSNIVFIIILLTVMLLISSRRGGGGGGMLSRRGFGSVPPIFFGGGGGGSSSSDSGGSSFGGGSFGGGGAGGDW